MKLAVYLSLLLLNGLLACQKPTDVVTPNEASVNQPGSTIDTPATGTPTEAGQPTGAPTTKTIGPAGGTISTPDGALTLSFPAGALANETPITIQPIENKAFNGAGSAYRFSPDGTQFAKLVTMTWHYQPEDINGSAPEALGIAFQDKQNVWQGSTQVQVNKTTRTVSAQLPHFSDWTFFEQFVLRAPSTKSDDDVTTLAPADHVKLTAYYLDFPKSTSATKEVEVAPLTPAKALLAERVVRWTINGITADDNYDDYGNNGQLSQDNTFAQATYDAPPREPDTNPVSVAVEIDLKEKGHVILVRYIRIESTASLTIGGSVDNNPVVGMTVMGSQLIGSISNSAGTQSLNFIIKGFQGKGTYKVDEKANVTITPVVQGRVPYLDGYFDQNAKWISGGGTITITEYGGNGKPMAGRIVGNFFWQETPTKLTTVPASANFRSVPVVL